MASELDTAQRRAEAVAIELLERMGLRGHPAASQFVGDILEHDKQTRRAALLEACVAVSQFSSDGRPIDTQELRIALVQLLGEMAK